MENYTMEWKPHPNWELRTIDFSPHSVPVWGYKCGYFFLWMARRMEWVDKDENHLIRVLKYRSRLLPQIF